MIFSDGKKELMKEYLEGQKAYKENKELTDNPYPIDGQHAIDWINGYLKADALENREYIGLGSSNTLHF